MRYYIMFNWNFNNLSVNKINAWTSSPPSLEFSVLDTVFVGGVGYSLFDTIGSIAAAYFVINKVKSHFHFVFLASVIAVAFIVLRLIN